jgi:hypothetical protein
MRGFAREGRCCERRAVRLLPPTIRPVDQRANHQRGTRDEHEPRIWGVAEPIVNREYSSQPDRSQEPGCRKLEHACVLCNAAANSSTRYAGCRHFGLNSDGSTHILLSTIDHALRGPLELDRMIRVHRRAQPLDDASVQLAAPLPALLAHADEAAKRVRGQCSQVEARVLVAGDFERQEQNAILGLRERRKALYRFSRRRQLNRYLRSRARPSWWSSN